MLIIIGMYFTISFGIYFAFDRRDIPIKLYVNNIGNFHLSRSNVLVSKHTYPRQISVTSDICSCMFAVFSSLSFFWFVILGSAGFCFYGAEFLKKYIFRPSLPEPEELVLAKIVLRENSQDIIKESRMVYSIKEDLRLRKYKMKICEAQNKTKIMRKKMVEIQERSIMLKEMIQIYKRQSKFDEENPLVLLSYAVLGGLIYLIGFIFFVNNFYLLNDLHFYSDGIYYFIRSYLGTGIFYILMLIVYFVILMAIVTGYLKMSQLIPNSLLRYHVIKEDKTWTDDFLKTCNILMISSLGTLMAFVKQFSVMVFNTKTYELLNNTYSNVFPFSFFVNTYYGNLLFLVFFSVGFIFVFFEISPIRKLRMLIKEKREDLKFKRFVINQNFLFI